MIVTLSCDFLHKGWERRTVRVHVYTVVPPRMLVWTIWSVSIPAEIPGSTFIRSPGKNVSMLHVSPIFQNISFLCSLCTILDVTFPRCCLEWGRLVRGESDGRGGLERGLRASEPTRIRRPSLSISLSSDRRQQRPCPRGSRTSHAAFDPRPHVLTCEAFTNPLPGRPSLAYCSFYELHTFFTVSKSNLHHLSHKKKKPLVTPSKNRFLLSNCSYFQFSSVQSVSHVWLFSTP